MFTTRSNSIISTAAELSTFFFEFVLNSMRERERETEHNLQPFEMIWVSAVALRLPNDEEHNSKNRKSETAWEIRMYFLVLLGGHETIQLRQLIQRNDIFPFFLKEIL